MRLSKIIKLGVVSVGLVALLQGCLVVGEINVQNKEQHRQQQYFSKYSDSTQSQVYRL